MINKRTIFSVMQAAIRKRVINLLVLSLFIVVFMFGACAGPTQTGVVEASDSAKTVMPAVEPARTVESKVEAIQAIEPAIESTEIPFKVTSLSISPTKVDPGQSVQVSARVNNTGDSVAVYMGELQINNAVEELKTLVLRAGETKSLPFSIVKYEPGIYSVILDTHTVQFEVLDRESSTQNLSVPSCCDTSNSSDTSITQPSCCETSSPITPTKPTTQIGGCCGG